MAIGACFGGPVLNVLLGMGIACLLVTSGGQRYPFENSRHLLVSSCFLLVSLLSSLIYIPFNRFRCGRPFGIYLICLYVVFIISSVAIEFI